MSEETRRQRIEEINQMRQEGIEPYPYSFDKTHWAAQIKSESPIFKIRKRRKIQFLVRPAELSP